MRARTADAWHRLAICASTNDEAQKLARQGAEEGTVVVAAEQTRGRGRLGRHWHSPADENLYLSVVLRPNLSPQKAPLLSLCAGLAMHEAARIVVAENHRAEHGAARVRLKWPNDLLGQTGDVNSPWRKLGGILTELVCVGMHIEFVIVGVGCNVGGTEFPEGVEATSLRLLTHEALLAKTAVDRFGEQFLSALAEHYETYLTHGARPIIESFSRAAELGKTHAPVVVRSGKLGPLTGIPVGLGTEGELLLEVPNGTLIPILTGDVALASSVAAS